MDAGRMKGPAPRGLTSAEAKVLAVLLGAGGEPESQREEGSGLPRSTYVVVRRRAYQEGWVYDRFLPHPALGFSSVRFLVAQPFLESRAELAARWRALPGSVVVWSVGDTALGVVFESPNGGRPEVPPAIDPALCRNGLSLRCDLTEASVPVFFDFEGVWAHFAELGPPRSYPRPLGRLDGEDGRAELPTLSPGFLRSATQLLARPFLPEESERRYRFGLSGLPRSQQSLCRQGWVEWRVFPNLDRIPSYRGLLLRRLVLIQGELVPGASLEGLYWSLRREAGIWPFLLAAEGNRVLLGALGVRPGGAGELPPRLASRASPVLPTLLRSLRNVVSFHEELGRSSLDPDHRYDRVGPVLARSPRGPLSPASRSESSA